MANHLSEVGVRTIVAYPTLTEQPATLAGSAAIAVALNTQLEKPSARAALQRFIKRENVQVVYFTDRPAWSVWYRSLRSAGVRRIVVHDHTSGTRSTPKGVRRLLKRIVVNAPGVASDSLVAVSDFVAERNRVTTLVPPSRIRRVWNGVDPIPPGSEEGRPDIHAVLGLDHTVPVIGCACRATREKGVDVLFKAFDDVCAKTETSAVLAYVGSGPAYEELVSLRKTLACRDRIFLIGYLPEPATLLRTATVCAVPSVWQEAFALSVLEMMARGRPVVATRVGGIPEVIEDGVSGLLVSAGDVDGLAKTLSAVLESPTLQASLGNAARVRAGRLFTAERQVQEMLGTFRDAFGS